MQQFRIYPVNLKSCLQRKCVVLKTYFRNKTFTVINVPGM